MRAFVPPRLLRAAAVALGVIAIAAVLAHAEHDVLSRDLAEAGDFAANSLLVLQAKRLTLLHGNYSRVGFNHPGPALLYVLAAGEYVFHDVLRWTRSPFAGQLLAICAYAACWLITCGVLLRRIWRSTTTAIVMGAVSLACVGLTSRHALVGAWFPHLYLLPFATFTLATAGLTLGRSDCLVALALSVGFLVHGHVAFVAIVAVMLVAALVTNARLSREVDTSRIERVWSRTYVTRHRTTLRLAAAILVLFALPIVLETALRFPGQLGDYVAFTRENRGHRVLATAWFVSRYWGGHPIALVVGLLLLASLWGRRGGPDEARAALPRKALVATLLSATFALFLYAMIGVDRLGERYLGFFYGAVPAYALGLACAVVLGGASARRARGAAVLALVLVSVLVHAQATRRPDYLGAYQSPDGPRLAAALRRHGRGLVVLELDGHAGWGEVWSEVLAAQLDAARHGGPPICIGDNWHVSFTREARCSPEQRARGTRLLVSAAPRRDTTQDVIFRGHALCVRALRTPRVSIGQTLSLVDSRARPLVAQLLLDDWSYPEHDRVWTTSRSASLLFDLDVGAPPRDARHAELELLLEAYLPEPTSTQDVEILVDGHVVACAHFDVRRVRQHVRVPLRSPRVSSTGARLVTIHVARVVSPRSLGRSRDPRTLGVALRALRVDAR